MKETGTDRAVDFYNRGDPRSVANRSLRRELAEMFAKAAGNPSKFAGRLKDVLVIDAGLILKNQLFDLFFECSGFFEVQADFALFFARPYERAVEGRRGEVGCEKGDGVETKCPCCLDGLAQMTMVSFLDGRAASDGHARVVVTNSGDPLVDEIVASVHTADGIVNFRGAIKGDDDVVEEGGDLFCPFVQEKPCGQEREVNLSFAEKIAQSGKIVVQQRFAACKNDLTNTKVFERSAMTLQILGAHLLTGFALPNVAHDTAAVTAIVGVQDENGKTREPR